MKILFQTQEKLCRFSKCARELGLHLRFKLKEIGAILLHNSSLLYFAYIRIVDHLKKTIIFFIEYIIFEANYNLEKKTSLREFIKNCITYFISFISLYLRCPKYDSFDRSVRLLSAGGQ